MKSNLSGEFIVLNPFLVKDLKARGLWDQDMIDNLKYFDGELKDIERIPADLKAKYLTAFDIDPKWIIDAAARRQKWIDQSQSREPLDQDARPEDAQPHVPPRLARRAEDDVLPAHLGASNIEKATVAVKKEVRIGASDAGATPSSQGLDSTPPIPAKPEYSEEEKKACSIEAMRRGEICEACQ